MNKLRLSIAAAGAALALWGSPVLNAHEGADDAAKASGESWGSGHQAGIFKDLGLDAGQSENLKAAWKEQAETAKPLREKRKADFEQLRALVDRKASDNDLSAAINALKADQQALEEQRKKQQEAIAALLTPRQQALLVLRMGEGMQRMGEAWKKGRANDSKL
jgi:Spy/CpxP family protein refolding chaperone